MDQEASKNIPDLQLEAEEEMGQDGDTTAAADKNPEPRSSSFSKPVRAITKPVIPVSIHKKTPLTRTRTYYTKFSSKNSPSIFTPSPSAEPVFPLKSHQDEDTTPTTSSINSLSCAPERRLHSMPPNDISSTELVVTTNAAVDAIKNPEPTSSSFSEPERATTAASAFTTNFEPILNEHDDIQVNTPRTRMRAYNTRASSKSVYCIPTLSSSSPSADSSPSTSHYDEGTTPTTSSTDSLSSTPTRERRASRRATLKNTSSSPLKHPRQKGNFSSATPYFPRYSKIKNKAPKEHGVDRTKGGTGFHCLCGIFCSNKLRFKEHIKYFNGEPKFQCEKCPLRFVFFSLLKQHMEGSHKIKMPANKVGCGDCGAIFDNREDWIAHRRAMQYCGASLDHAPDTTDNSGLKCICGKCFATKKSLTSHIRNYRCVQKKKPRLRADNTLPSSTASTQIQRAKADSANPIAAAKRAKRREWKRKLKTTPSSTHPRQIGNFSSAIPYVPRYSKMKNRTPKEHGIDETKLEEGFYCLCEKSFSNPNILKGHIRYFNRDPKFQCEKCPVRFLALSTLKQHMLSTHKIKASGDTIGCGDCGAIFQNREDWKAHCLAKHIKDFGASLLHCPDLSYGSGFKCVCGKQFATNVLLLLHIRNYMNLHDFKCPSCVRSFKSVARVQQHSKSVHKKWAFPKGTYGCNFCGKLFTFRKEHLEHMKKEHGCYHTALSKPVAHRPQPMSPEARNKNPNRRHRCLCGAALKNETNLKIHIRTLSNRMTFKCPDCPGEFSICQRMATHVRTIHKKKDYKAFGCYKCGKTFPTMVARRRHGDSVHGRPKKSDNQGKSKDQDRSAEQSSS